MFPFESLVVYKRSFSAQQKVYKILIKAQGIPNYLKSQLGRAGMSIMLNIAEGSGRFSNKDRRHFFIIARGSVFECVSILDFLHTQGEIPIENFQELRSLYIEISKLLFTMIKNLE